MGNLARLGAALVVGSLFLAACSQGGGTVGTPAPAAPTDDGITVESTIEVTVETPAPAGPTIKAKLKQVVPISCNGEPCLEVAVLAVKSAKSYMDDYNYVVKPKSGRIFLAVQVNYKATGSGAAYNPFDWSAYVDDVAVEPSFAGAGPSPKLDSGDLARGKKAVGWVDFEVPPKGRVIVAYQPSGDAIFEVVVRSK